MTEPTDADLTAWARLPVAGVAGDADRAIARALAALPPVATRRLRPAMWFAGATSIAAAVAAAVIVFPASAPAPAPRAMAAQVDAADDAALFALIFTPTPDEETLL